MWSLLREVDREKAMLARSILQVSGMNSDMNFLPLKEAHAYVLTHGMNAFFFLLLFAFICAKSLSRSGVHHMVNNAQ